MWPFAIRIIDWALSRLEYLTSLMDQWGIKAWVVDSVVSTALAMSALWAGSAIPWAITCGLVAFAALSVLRVAQLQRSAITKTPPNLSIPVKVDRDLPFHPAMIRNNVRIAELDADVELLLTIIREAALAESDRILNTLPLPLDEPAWTEITDEWIITQTGVAQEFLKRMWSHFSRAQWAHELNSRMHDAADSAARAAETESRPEHIDPFRWRDYVVASRQLYYAKQFLSEKTKHIESTEIPAYLARLQERLEYRRHRPNGD
jgi:hypothetical protein